MVIRIGLISDTHMPQRWRELPPRVFSLFNGVDLILHAGDVGELWVIDRLSSTAPVIAVHGNDETPAAEAAYPYLQTLSIANHRLVLTHAHHPLRADEMASRKDNSWGHILDRRANFAKQHGASICIFGHTHIPMVLDYEGVLLVNPGAIASGNVFQRQKIQTVAIMTLTENNAPHIQHFDLNTGAQFTPQVDFDAGFLAASQQFEEPIVTPELYAVKRWLQREIFTVSPAFAEAWLAMAHEVWAGQRGIITPDDVLRIANTLTNPELDAALKTHDLFAK